MYPSGQNGLKTINGVYNSFIFCNIKSPNVTVGNAVLTQLFNYFFTISFKLTFYSIYDNYKINNNRPTL